LIEGLKAGAVLADKAYDVDHLTEKIQQQDAHVVTPSKQNRKIKRPRDEHRYKERNVVEHFFNKLKHFRRVATRYDKLLANFMGFVKLAATAIWLRSLNCHYGLARLNDTSTGEGFWRAGRAGERDGQALQRPRGEIGEGLGLDRVAAPARPLRRHHRPAAP
jgi:putative transposase